MTDSLANSYHSKLVRMAYVQRVFLIFSLIGPEIIENEDNFIVFFTRLFILDCKNVELSKAFPFLYSAIIFYFTILTICHTFLIFQHVLRIKNQRREIKYLQIISSIHWNLLFIPCQNILSIYLSYYSKNDSSLWTQTASASLPFLAIVGLALNSLLGGFLCKFNFSCKFDNIVSRGQSNIELNNLLIKSATLLHLILSQISTGDGMKETIILITVLEGINLILMILKNPYFHLVETHWNITTTSINLSLTLIYFCKTKLESMNITPILAWLIIFGILGVILKNFFVINPNWVYEKNLLNFDENESVRNLSVFFSALTIDPNIEFFIFKKPRKFLFFMGFIKNHREACLKPDCFCKFFESSSSGTGISNLSEKYFDFLETLKLEYFEKQLMKCKNSTWLKLTYVQILLQMKPYYYPKALQIMSSMISSQDSLYLKNVMTNMYDEIADIIQREAKTHEEKVDIGNYIKLKSETQKLKELINSGTNIGLEFWREYTKDIMNLENLYKIGFRFNQNQNDLSSFC